MQTDWIQQLKVGDRFAVQTRDVYRLASVDRLTATQIITDKGNRFFRRTGWLVGEGTWPTTRMVPLTDELLKKIEQRKAEVRLGQIDWEDNPHARAVWEFYYTLSNRDSKV